MNNVQNQNGKVLEEMLAGSNSDATKTTLRGLRSFQNSFAPFASSWKASRHSFDTLSLVVERITNGLVGLGVTFTLVGCRFKPPGNFDGLSDPNYDEGVRFKLGIRQWWILDGEEFPLPMGQPNEWLQIHFVLIIAYDAL